MRADVSISCLASLPYAILFIGREGYALYSDVKRDRYYASTQICSECGHRLEGENRLTLKDREWTCPECGKHHDRDENAAINILTGGASSGIRASVEAEDSKTRGNTRAASAA